MAPTITRDEVLRIAGLAHLDLTAEEVEMFARQLTDILAYAAAIGEADTGGVAPTAHPLPVETVWREDAPVESLDRDAALSQAPDGDPATGLFKVPRVR